MELTRGGAGSEVLNDLSDSLTKAEYFAQQIYVEEIEFQLVKVEWSFIGDYKFVYLHNVSKMKRMYNF